VTSTLADIRTKIRRITARPSASQITDTEIDNYINTFYVFDLPEHLRLESLRVNYQFITNAHQPVYDFPTDLYLTAMPPVYIAGYQSYMTQSRENFFRINATIQYKQNNIATGIGDTGPYIATLTSTPILRGFKPNPPGAYNVGVTPAPRYLNWNVLISGKAASGLSVSLIDDGQGSLFDITDTDCSLPRGTINYITGAISIPAPPALGFATPIAVGESINAQYIPYQASRPQSAIFFNDQIMLYPVPDEAYTVSFEAFKYPTALAAAGDTPQLLEWWQLLAYGAADKIFSDNADFDSMQKFRPLLDEQMRLVQRRTLQQYSSERTASIYTEQAQFSQFPFGNMFGGI
jgi:hypothetical protein